MYVRPGPGTHGYNALPEFIDKDCVVRLPNGTQLLPGHPLFRELTAFPSTTGADMVVLGSANAPGRLYGLYQGPRYTNNTGGIESKVIQARVRGLGIAFCRTPLAVTVGGSLAALGAGIVECEQTATPAANGSYVGVATATGPVTAVGATILPKGAPALYVNCAISIS